MKITKVENLHIKIDGKEAYSLFNKKHPMISLPEFFESKLVHVSTDEGIDGYADGEAGALAARRLVGRDPTLIEFLIENGIIANEPFLEHALWDIIGKISGQPVYKILGGHKNKVKVYLTTVWKHRRKGIFGDPDDWVKVAESYVENGFKAMKIQVHRPDPFDDLKTIQAIRDRLGDQIEIMCDRTARPHITDQELGVPHHGWTWSQYTAVKMARALEKLNVTWLEEPLDRNDLDGLSELAAAVDIPITGGEAERGIHKFKLFLEKRCFDIVQPDVHWGNGILVAKKIAVLAEAFGKPCVYHGADGFGAASTLQVTGAVSNCSWYELTTHVLFPRYPYSPPEPVILPWERWEPYKLLVEDKPLYEIRDGYIKIPDRPGLGLRFIPEALDKYTVKRELISSY